MPGARLVRRETQGGVGAARNTGVDAAAARFVTRDDVAKSIRISSVPRRHVAWLREYDGLGVDTIYLFNVNTNQRAFIGAFSAEVLPDLT